MTRMCKQYTMISMKCMEMKKKWKHIPTDGLCFSVAVWTAIPEEERIGDLKSPEDLIKAACKKRINSETFVDSTTEEERSHLEMIMEDPTVLKTHSLWDSDAAVSLNPVLCTLTGYDFKQLRVRPAHEDFEELLIMATENKPQGEERTKILVNWACPENHWDLIEEVSKSSVSSPIQVTS